jgi:15-cis-phytoene desaturase
VTTVIVIGGGVAGMSAAHELIERGFAVRVFERQSLPGGKARSVSAPGTGTGGRPDLPGEHGFRFFPRFYRHVIDTMERIPVPGAASAAANLVQASREEIAIDGKHSIVMDAWFPRSLADIRTMLAERVSISELGLTPEDQEVFADRVWQLMTTSRERSLEEYERLAWTAFLGADQRSEAFRRLLVGGLTRSLIAATPKEASTDVGGSVLVELFYALLRPGTSEDRLLCGPTNDVWLTPWLAYLRRRGVDYHLDAKVTAIEVSDRQISGVRVREGGGETVISGDYYVAALPVERMADLLTDEMVAIDPILAGIRTLAGDTRWMTGIQFYLTDRVPVVNGHVTYIETPWALTSISQAQFWPKVDLSRYGDGTVRDILSVDMSDWDTPGRWTTTKCAEQCTPDEIADEVWAQLQHALGDGGEQILPTSIRHGWYLDRDIRRHDGRDHDAEPLLVNKAGRWNIRPTAHTGIANLFLASDYVRTNTNLATMEAANEAARRAVNGIIDAAGSSARACAIWPLYQPWILAPLRWYDARRYAKGLGWDPSPPWIVRVAHAIAGTLGVIVTRLRLRRVRR